MTNKETLSKKLDRMIMECEKMKSKFKEGTLPFHIYSNYLSDLKALKAKLEEEVKDFILTTTHMVSIPVKHREAIQKKFLEAFGLKETK
jgi:hypothetical protein